MANDPTNPPSGYDVPPDLGAPDAKPKVPVPSGYDVPPDLSGGISKSAAPVPEGYDAPPDLTTSDANRSVSVPSGSGGPGEHTRSNTVGGPPPEGGETAQAVASARFKMKSMGQEYIDGEKNQPGKRVEIDGQAVEVRDKEWLRAKTNEKRAGEGKEPISKERWDQAWEEQEVAATEYMGEERAAQHQVGFEPGIDSSGQANAKLTGESVRGDGKHIFVMDGQGEVFAKQIDEAHAQRDEKDRGVHVHHSSFKSGEAVAGAGEMVVDNEGYLKEVTDRSGHYRPGEEQTAQTLEHLEQAKGVNLDNTKFTVDRSVPNHEDKTTGMAREYLQGQVTSEEIEHRQKKIDAGADIQAKPEGQMEQTFKKRHNVADELKDRTMSVRKTLDMDADRRATRVRKAGEYLDAGRSNAEVSPAVQQHAAKDEVKLKREFDRYLAESLNDNLTEEQAAKLAGPDDEFSAASDAYSANDVFDGDGDPKLGGSDVDPADDLGENKPSVRESLGNSLGSRQSQASNGVRVK